MKLDLQFFGEDLQEVTEPAETSEAVETEETEAEAEGTEETESEKPAPAPQTAEQNHIFADMRRRAEAEAKKKYEAQQRDIDRQYAEMFKGYVNPETNKPIESAADYVEAMAAQERAKARSQIQQAGIDPEAIDRMIAASPVIRRAEEIERANMERQAQQMMEEDIKSIIEFDPTVGSAEDLYAQENFGEVLDYCKQHGVRMSDAYKLVNFDRLSNAKIQAGKQAAINQAKGKGHLAPVTGLTDKDKSNDIPVEQLSKWKQWFPDKSAKELRALYNKAGG